MQSRFISGMITGGVIGATTSMYLNGKMSGRRKKNLMRRSRKIMKGFASFMNIF